MAMRPLMWLVLAVALLGPPLAHAASAAPAAGVQGLLERAEHVKSSDPKLFQSLVNDLQKYRQAATVHQREQIEYLTIYDLTFKGQYEKAVARARTLIESSADSDMQFRAGVLIANIYALSRQFTEGLRQLESTLALVEQVKSSELRHQGLGVAAFTYSQVGQHQLALRYAERILEDLPQPRTQCFANQVKFEALNSLGTLPQKDDSILQAIEQ